MEQLATQCPHCGTQFRVTLAQLELRDGKVRCGACREVFNGIDTVFEHTGEAGVASAASRPPAASADAHDLSNRMTLFDVDASAHSANAGASNMQEELDALSRAIADLQSKPWAAPEGTHQTEFTEDAAGASSVHQLSAKTAADSQQDTDTFAAAPPVFVQRAQQDQRERGRWRVLLWIGIPLLVIALIAQLGWLFRNEIAARSPQAGQWLRAACARLHCEIKLPLNLEQLSVSASRLEQAPPPEAANQPAANGAEPALRMNLVALLQNTSDTVQTWPALELALRDTDGTLLVRKVFMADSYVSVNEQREGMPPRSEREIRLPLTLSGEPPAGFAVSIFYP
ncbi:MAG: DUF3426 domain-containing protein [Burkholderiaceae bacterium]